MPPVPPPKGDGAPAVPLALLDDLLAAIAGVIHDQPVQSLVAARLLIETSIDPSQRDETLDRGLTAIATAGEQARDLMWALGGVAVRPGHLAADVRDAVARLGPDGVGVDVVVQVAEDVDHELVSVAVHALHELLIEVMGGGGHVHRVRMLSDAEALHVAVTSDAGSPEGDANPWLRLARARLTPVGGTLVCTRDGQVQTSDIVVPLA